MYRFLGINYRMTELHAAVGLAQLEKVTNTVERRRRLGDRLSEALRGIPNIIPAPVTPGGTHSYWLYPLRVSGSTAKHFAKALTAEGVPASAGYIGKPIFRCAAPLAEKKTYGDSGFPFDSHFTDRKMEYPEDLCPVTQEILDQLVIISFNENYTDENTNDIAGAVRKVANGLA